jgi:hypothetical protein
VNEAWLTMRARSDGNAGYDLTAVFEPSGPREVFGKAWRHGARVYDVGSPRLRKLPWYTTVEGQDGALEHAYHRTLHDCLTWGMGRAMEARSEVAR